MTPQRLSIKFFLREPESFDPVDCIPVFHRWIQKKLTNELLIDVADYTHVPNGPSVMLVGLEGEYLIDGAAGRMGVRYIRKRALPEGLTAVLYLVLYQGAVAARRLEEELGAAVDPREIEVVVLDKLRYPNTSASFEAVAAILRPVAETLFDSQEVNLERGETDERLPLAVRVKTSADIALPELIDRLEASGRLVEGDVA
jgi:hypothetical protein